MKYVEPKVSTSYIENVQQQLVRFTFANKTIVDGEEVMVGMFHWVSCRDYFSDVIIAEASNIAVEAYGFVYDPKVNKIDRDKTRLLVRTEHTSNIVSNLEILNKIEDNNKIERTTITVLDEDTLCIEGDSFWMNNTFSMHLYTFLIKCISFKYKNKEDWFTELKDKASTIHEAWYARTVIPEFLDIINTSLQVVFKKVKNVHGYILPKNMEMERLHNMCGFYTLFKIDAKLHGRTAENLYWKCIAKILKKGIKDA